MTPALREVVRSRAGVSRSRADVAATSGQVPLHQGKLPLHLTPWWGLEGQCKLAASRAPYHPPSAGARRARTSTRSFLPPALVRGSPTKRATPPLSTHTKKGYSDGSVSSVANKSARPPPVPRLGVISSPRPTAPIEVPSSGEEPNRKGSCPSMLVGPSGQ